MTTPTHDHETGTGGRAHARARRRDRRVYLGSHPLLFGLLALARVRPVVRVGSIVLVSDTAAYRQVLTDVPLDRVAQGTTGGTIARHTSASTGPGAPASHGALFEMSGEAHRRARRDAAAHLGARAVDAIRPSWQPVVDRATAELAAGAEVDLCRVADAISGHTTAALFDVGSSEEVALRIAAAARSVAGAAITSELPGLRNRSRRRRDEQRLHRGLDELCELLGRDDPFALVIALAAVNTTYAGLPRMVAWTADAGLWADASDEELLPTLAGELLRVTAPSPILPRVTESDSVIARTPVPAGTQLVLVARHAARAHDRPPDARHPEPAATRALVFGAGAHSCPGVHLARAQATDVLGALAPYAPRVTAAAVDRRAGLPAWRTLRVRATTQP